MSLHCLRFFNDNVSLSAPTQFPSQYTIIRQNALKHALDKFNNDQYDNVPLFIFGDFNFRLDTKAVVEVSKLTNGFT